LKKDGRKTYDECECDKEQRSMGQREHRFDIARSDIAHPARVVVRRQPIAFRSHTSMKHTVCRLRGDAER
jgi:hypothetical protein